MCYQLSYRWCRRCPWSRSRLLGGRPYCVGKVWPTRSPRRPPGRLALPGSEGARGWKRAAPPRPPPRPAEAAAGAAAACALSRPPALRPPARPPPPSTRPGVSFPLPPPPPPPPPSSSARPRGPPRLPARPYCSAPGLPPFPFPPAPLFPSVASRLQVSFKILSPPPAIALISLLPPFLAGFGPRHEPRPRVVSRERLPPFSACSAIHARPWLFRGLLGLAQGLPPSPPPRLFPVAAAQELRRARAQLGWRRWICWLRGVGGGEWPTCWPGGWARLPAGVRRWRSHARRLC